MLDLESGFRKKKAAHLILMTKDSVYWISLRIYSDCDRMGIFIVE